jgi:UDP-glucose 4-epimerase
VDETVTCATATAYGRAKLATERCVLDKGLAAGMHVACLRPPAVYGPGCRGNVLTAIRIIDRAPLIPLVAADCRRSFVHVTAVVQALKLPALSPRAQGKVHNVTDEMAYSPRFICEAIARALGKHWFALRIPLASLKAAACVADLVGRLSGGRFPRTLPTLGNLLSNAVYSTEQIARDLGYNPTSSFDAALPEIITWHRTLPA